MHKHDSIVKEVDSESEGMRLDVAIVRSSSQLLHSANLSRSAIARAIASGSILLNDAVAKPHHRVRKGDRITIAVPIAEEVDVLKVGAKVFFEVLFACDAFIVINKPAGLVVHPSGYSDVRQTLAHGLLARYPELRTVGEDPLRPGIVHRLDGDTSGVMIIARTQEAFNFFKGAFKNRAIEKTYYAITHNNPRKRSGTIDFPIARSVRGNKQVALRTERDKYKGTVRSASTYYSVLCANGGYSFVRLRPQTGRTHQIRVHLHAQGCPIVGDALYKHRGRVTAEIGRQALHAGMIRFEYRGHAYAFAIPMPSDMCALWKSICKEHLM